VRDPAKLERQCALLDIDRSRVSAVPRDILDASSVRDALDGCDACVHAAAFTSLTWKRCRRRTRSTRRAPAS
jgi:nucleoside-diphosphate-sugar epimerase